MLNKPNLINLLALNIINNLLNIMMLESNIKKCRQSQFKEHNLLF